MRILITILLFILSASCGQKNDAKKAGNLLLSNEPAASIKGDTEKGKLIYEKYCFYCHGRDGRGNGAVAIGLSDRPVDFISDTRRLAKSDTELFKSISNGIIKEGGSKELVMPMWKNILSEDERWNVLAYVRYLSKKQ